jgi:glycosyltransferase involved in cell wall biosynthesis
MKKLKIRTYGMMATIGTQGNAASWALTIHYLADQFLKQGHELYLNTTNGIKGVPKHLLKYFRDCNDPDIDIVYTLPQNWPHRFTGALSGTKKAKLRLGIFNYESSILPPGWAEYSQYVDYILPSSEYVRDIFLRAGIPDEKVVVLPLGVDFDALNAPIDEGFEFNTKKKFKLLNISIPHARKNIPALIDAYFTEFTADDDICLIIKTTVQGKRDHFEIDIQAAFNQIKELHKDKNLPEIILLEHRFNNMATIYKKTDALINIAASEGFGLPLLEAMACDKLVAGPRYGGVLDFLNKDNSLLIDTVEVHAPAEYQYWQPTQGATVGHPLKESIQAVMRSLYRDHEQLHSKFDSNMKETIERYTWDNSVKLILDLFDGKRPTRQLGELL